MARSIPLRWQKLVAWTRLIPAGHPSKITLQSRGMRNADRWCHVAALGDGMCRQGRRSENQAGRARAPFTDARSSPGGCKDPGLAGRQESAACPTATAANANSSQRRASIGLPVAHRTQKRVLRPPWSACRADPFRVGDDGSRGFAAYKTQQAWNVTRGSAL